MGADRSDIFVPTAALLLNLAQSKTAANLFLGQSGHEGVLPTLLEKVRQQNSSLVRERCAQAVRAFCRCCTQCLTTQQSGSLAHEISQSMSTLQSPDASA